MEQYLQGAGIQSGFSKNLAFADKQKPFPSQINESETTLSSGGFECNICLDLVQDPVVTFCGHLYCWPCIYKWISYQNSSPENQDSEQPYCPVCKAEVSEKTLIPLYGRGKNVSKEHGDVPIPQRPKCEDSMSIRNITSGFSHPVQQLNHRNAMAPLMVRLGGTTTHRVDPMIGMFGEMVYTRFFGSPQAMNSYHLEGTMSNNRRLRRHIMESEKSLSRICFFLCCCVILCLILF